MSAEVEMVVTTILIVLLAIAPVPAIIATAYLWGLYRGDPARPRSWLLRLMSTTATITTVSVCYVGFLAMWRLLGLGPLPQPFVMALAVDLIALAAVPVYKAIRIYFAAHGGTRPTIPQNGHSGDEVRDDARDAARDPERDEERDEVRDPARDEGRDIIRDPARDLARDVEHDEEGVPHGDE